MLESRVALRFFFVAKPVWLFCQFGDCSWSLSLPVVLSPHSAQHAGAEVPLLNSSEDFMPCVVLAWLWCLLAALGSSVSFCL